MASNPTRGMGEQPPTLADLYIIGSEVTQNCKLIYFIHQHHAWQIPHFWQPWEIALPPPSPQAPLVYAIGNGNGEELGEEAFLSCA